MLSDTTVHTTDDWRYSVRGVVKIIASDSL